jgi:hypothetical protein
MVKRTKKLSKKLSKVHDYYSILDKNEKAWKKKGKGYLMFKSDEAMLKEFLPDLEKKYVALKRCSQEHCRKEFDFIMIELSKEWEQEYKKMYEEMNKSIHTIEKTHGIKKGESSFDLKDKKLAQKIKKEIAESDKNLKKKYEDPMKQKYRKYRKELEECQLKHCKHDKNTFKRALKKKSKRNYYAKTLYKKNTL